MKLSFTVFLSLICIVLIGCNNSVNDGSVVNVKIGQGTNMNPRLFGSNGVHETSADPASSLSYQAMLRALHVRGIRYPSGSPASFWDWNTGHFIPEQEITKIWPPGAFNWMLELVEDTKDVPDHLLGPIKFNEFGYAINAEVQWMLNLTTREYDQLNALKALKEDGANIQYVEMDNETYFWSEEFGKHSPATNYAKRVSKLSPSIRALFPDVKIGIVTREDDLFEASHTDDSEAMKNWNPTILSDEFTPHFDALILHHYVMKKQKLDPYHNDIDRGKAFLAYPTATLDRASNLIKKRFGDYKMWITEYNVIAYYPQFHGTGESAQWMINTRDTGWNALYQVSFILNGMNNPDSIEVLNHHSINNLDYGWGLGMPINEQSGKITKMGQLFSHLSSMAREYELMHPVTFTNNPSLNLTIEADDQQKALYGAALSSNNKKALWLINRSNEVITLNNDVFSEYKHIQMTQYPAIENAPAVAEVNYDSQTPIWLQGPTKLVQQWLTNKQTIQIPAYSFVILEMKH